MEVDKLRVEILYARVQSEPKFQRTHMANRDAIAWPPDD
jgi:hypothetical protein